MTAGYSGTPLARKLGIVEGTTLTVLGDPGHFLDILAPIPAAVTVRRDLRARSEVVVFFTKSAAELAARAAALGRAIHPDAVLWVAWPKRAAGVPTDMTENVVRDVLLPLGMVDVKVAAVDETWSGLKIVYRLENR
jgi:hypothetical protein